MGHADELVREAKEVNIARRRQDRLEPDVLGVHPMSRTTI